MKTYLPKDHLNDRKWHVIDADGQVLGRLAETVANVLRGKNKPTFTPHLDCGDFVVVINAEKVKLTGKKEEGKVYMTYSGWRGGEKHDSCQDSREAPRAPDRKGREGNAPQEHLGPQALHQTECLQGNRSSARRPATLPFGS